MHPFENLFRNKFRQIPEGYVYRQWNQDVVFTSAEFEHFIAVRRRVWSNPLIWFGYLLGGIVAPFLMWRHGNDGAAIALALVLTTILVVLLIHVDRKPGEAAEARAIAPPPTVVDSSTRRWNAVIWIVLAIFQIASGYDHHDKFIFWAWLMILLVWTFRLGQDGWRSRSDRAAAS